uniref:UAA transporter n=1 Tax=Parastrongyloides trichosuri TaxID=131310 RepID=A0A0N4ZXF8_PARTI
MTKKHHSSLNIHEQKSWSVRAFHLVLCTAGIVVGYTIFGYIQEKVFLTNYGPEGEKFNYVLPLVFFQCSVNAITALICSKFNGNAIDKDTVPRTNYAIIAISYLVAMLTSNSALKHVPYPTQVLGKSCKPIPIMILGVLFASKHYNIKKYLYVLLIVIGVIIFSYKGNKVGSTGGFNFGYGEFLLLISLTADGTTGALQDRMRRDHYSDKWGMMFFMNMFSSIYLCVYTIYSGELFGFYGFVKKHMEAFYLIMSLSCASALGQCFIFKTVTEFGPLTCSIVTTIRKIISIILSVIAFGHFFSTQQAIGTIIVFGALLLDAIESKKSSSNKTKGK